MQRACIFRYNIFKYIFKAQIKYHRVRGVHICTNLIFEKLLQFFIYTIHNYNVIYIFKLVWLSHLHEIINIIRKI